MNGADVAALAFDVIDGAPIAGIDPAPIACPPVVDAPVACAPIACPPIACPPVANASVARVPIARAARADAANESATRYARRHAIVSFAIAVAAFVLSPATAHADTEWLGLPRRVSRAWSASRDTPAMNLLVVPRDIRTAGGELALFTWRGSSTSLRTGFGGMIELESGGETTGVGNLFPKAVGGILWRGSYAYYVALSLDSVAERMCDGCALELGLSYRHESQHYTGSNHGGDGMDYTDQPYMGDDVILDAAIATTRGDWYLAARALAFVYLPGRSSYAGGPGLDVHVRWRGARVHPFVGGYAEQLYGTELMGRRFDNAYLVRALAGVALPSTLGDVMIYLSADAGNRKGIVGNTEEATLGIGVRLSLGASER
jgi:hypothetical protein